MTVSQLLYDNQYCKVFITTYLETHKCIWLVQETSPSTSVAFTHVLPQKLV